MNHPRRQAIGLLILAMLCFSMVPNFLRYLIGGPDSGGLGLDPWAVNAARYLIAGLFWLPFVVVILRRHPAVAVEKAARVRPARVWADALVPGAINLVGQILWGIVPAYVEAGVIGFVIKLSFVFTVLFGLLFFADERVLGRQFWFKAGVAAALLGLVLVSWPNLIGAGRQSTIGMVILLATTVVWGGYYVSIKKFMAPYSSALSFGVISLYTSVGLLVCLALVGDPHSLATLAPGGWVVLSLSAFIGITFSHVMLYAGIKRIGAIVAGGVMMVSPFVTLVVAVLVLHEPAMSFWQLIGGLSIVAGGGLIVWVKHQSAPQAKHVEAK